MLVGDDVWLQILSYLEEKDVSELYSCGNPALNRIVAKRKSIFATRRWPSKINSETPMLLDLRLQNVNLSAKGSVIPNNTLELRFLPKTLTRLSLHLHTAILPFWVSDVSQANAQLEQLASALPSLHTLDTSFLLDTVYAFWTLPPTLTHFSSPSFQYKLRFHHEIALPKNLKVFRTRDEIASDRAATLKAFSELKDLREFWTEFRITEAHPDFPKVESISTNRLTTVSPLRNFPSAIAFAGHYYHQNGSIVDHPLKYWRSYGQFIDPSHLPRGIVKLTTMDHRRRVRLVGFSHLQLASIPSTLEYLFIWGHPHPGISKDAFSVLPTNLKLLDIKQVAFDLKILLPILPSSLTTLRTHGLNSTNVRLLQRFVNFTELGMYGGRMTANLARLLPRTLRSLTLQHVALTTKGKYQCKGSTEILNYSVGNPDTTALDASHLPSLTYLNVTPGISQTYWNTHFYEILKSIPTSIRHLILHYRAQTPVSIYPNSRNPTPRSEPTDLFSRLEDLNHFWLYASNVVLQDYGWFARSLPRHVEALFISIFDKSEVAHLPPSVRFIPQWSHLRGKLPNYLANYRQYEDFHDPWRGPKEKDYFSSLLPSGGSDPYAY